MFNFAESKTGEVSVEFGMPASYKGFAVGWTEYRFAPTTPGIIASAHVFLDGRIFNSTQEGNATARRYAFWIALHELGRVLGLGSVLDGKDIMDPRATYRNADQPMLSTLDLYAVQFLASSFTPASFVHLPGTIQYELVNAWNFLNANSELLTFATQKVRPSHDSQTTPPAVSPNNALVWSLAPEGVALAIAITLAIAILTFSRKKGNRQ